MKILIKFNKNYICFYDYSDFKDDDLSKTNILDYNDIVLSNSFIKENYDFVIDFIKKNILKKNINKVYIDKIKITEPVINIINNIQNLNYLYINEEKKVDINIFNYVLNNKNIKILNCFDINIVTFERLNLSRDLKIITRKNVCNNSYLYRINNIKSYSDLFYKNNITIDKKVNKTDLKLFNEFLKTNINLKYILIKYFDSNSFKEIISLLKKYDKKNIKIDIYENDTNIKDILNNIDIIKRKNKKLLNKNKIKIKIIYEDKYIKKNIFKELNLNYLKIMLLLIIICGSIGISLSYYISKMKSKNTINLSNKINNLVSNINKEDILNKKIEEDNKEKDKDENNIKTSKPKPKSAYFKKYSNVISELKKINKDTVGWLTIKNSTINYPIVKTNNNEKYLNYSFDNTKNPNGWLFMDYRNNPNSLDQNTIIYGHSGNYYVMFGSLYKVLNKNWYTNKNNQIITFNTENKNMSFQIFSIYTIENTNDYLINNFSSDESYINFINKIKSRSIYNFNTDVNLNDKILTLSTCYKDSNHRLVIHAKLKA